MEPRTITNRLPGSEPGSGLARAGSMRFTGAFMTLYALAACSEGRHPVLFYNGSDPFPAVIGKPMALTPAVFWTIGHYTVSPPLPPGLSLDEQSGVISGTPTQARGPVTYLVNARGAGARASFPLVLSVTEPPIHLSYPSAAAGPAGTALSPLVPTVAGTIEHYAVTPALPPAMGLQSATNLPVSPSERSPQSGHSKLHGTIVVANLDPRDSHSK